MKHFLIIAISAASLLLPLHSEAQTTQRLTASKANEYGLVYSLPITALDVTIETRHTETTPGEFYNYARRHLAINDAITKKSNTVEVASVTITPRGVADQDNRWLVQFKGSSSPFIVLNDAGIPLSVNAEPIETDAPELPVGREAEPTILERDVARQAMTQDMIRSSSTSKRAELAAARVFELRDMRSDLLSGQADNPPADGKAMQLVLNNISDQEQALTAMFAGTTKTWTTVRTLTVTPDSTGMAREVLARVSPFDGVLDADNLAGAPIYITIEPIRVAELPVNEKGEEKKFPKGGFAYQIPGSARVSVEFEGKPIASQEVQLSQLGVTFGIDPSVFTDKKAPSKAYLDPATGGILQLSPISE